MQNCHIAAALPPANCHTTPGSIIVILILVTIVVINIDNHICHNRYSNFNFPSAIINSCIREYWRSCIYCKMVKGHRLCITYHITSQFASSIVSVPFFYRSYLIRKRWNTLNISVPGSKGNFTAYWFLSMASLS